MAIPLLLMVQVAGHEYHDILHINSLSAFKCFENAHPEDMASGGADRCWILESITSGSGVLLTKNRFPESSFHTFLINPANKLTATLRC
jgi:hypothetical protein